MAHPFPPVPVCANHVATVVTGSATVFVEGLKCARVTDSADSALINLENTFSLFLLMRVRG